MRSYFATVRWNRGSDEFLKQHYSRGHSWQFDEGITVPASASPHVVRAPYAVSAAVDPEEALVAAVSSCHMLFALSILSKHAVVVDSYEDAAEGVMEERADGKVAMTRITLRPVITVSAGAPSAELFATIHHEAHDGCYIANSVNFPVTVEPKLVQR
jgi:organic hydroperoxide reductase OsmC/OhrA